MKSRISKLLLALPMATAIGIAQAQQASDLVLATVNGKQITQQDLMMYAGEHAAHMDQHEAAKLLHNMISHELLYQAALDKKVDQLPGVQAALDAQRRNLLAQAVVQEVLSKTPVSEEQLRAIYASDIGSDKQHEYHTRHILLDKQQDANAALARIKQGEDFAKVAQDMSTDFSSKDGGNMNWLSLGNMPPAYGEAVRRMKVGEHSTAPVQSEYGWHIIKLEASKEVEPPSYEMMRDSLQASAQQQIVTDYLEELQSKAKIELAQ